MEERGFSIFFCNFILEGLHISADFAMMIAYK